MEKVRYGIIGCGNMGTTHSNNFFKGKIQNAYLAAICDLKPEKMQAILALENATPGIKTYTDYHEMLNSGEIDAVIVAVPHYFHAPIVIDALNAGVNAISEKPAGVYTKQVKEMNAVADKSDKLFTMMFNQRTNCVYRKMREMVQNGELGEIRRVNWIITTWFRSQYYYDSGDWRATWRGEGGGVIFNQCPHQIDLLQWVLGMMPSKIRSHCHFGKWHDIEVEDDVTAYMEFPNGATGVFVTTTGDAPGTNRFEITGEKGKLVCEVVKKNGAAKGDFVLTFYKNAIGCSEYIKTATDDFSKPDCEVIEVETDGKNEQHSGIVNNFANAILGLEPLFVHGQEGLNGVEIMDAILLSTWLDKDVTLPIDDDLYYVELQKRVATGRVRNNFSAKKDKAANTEGSY